MSDVQEVARNEESINFSFENVQLDVISLPHSPIVSQITRHHGNSCCLRCSRRPEYDVDIEGVLDLYDLWGSLDYFNLEGVGQLPLSIPHLSESTRVPGNIRAESSESFSVPTGPFDFEKTLRAVTKKYVIALFLRCRFHFMGS